MRCKLASSTVFGQNRSEEKHPDMEKSVVTCQLAYHVDQTEEPTELSKLRSGDRIPHPQAWRAYLLGDGPEDSEPIW